MAINWIQYTEDAVGAGHPTAADVVNRPLQEILTTFGLATTALPGLPGPVFNVKAYGATGDGATSDLTAITAALTAASAAVGTAKFVTVWFPPAVYNIGVGIVVPSGVSVDFGGSRLIQTSGTGVAVDATLYESFIARGILSRSSIASHAGPVSNMAGTGLKLTNSAWGHVIGIEADGFRIPFHVLDSTELDIYSPVASDYLYGLYFQTSGSGKYTTAIRVFGGALTCAAFSSMTGSRGIFLDKAVGSTLDGISIYATTNEGPVERKLLTTSGVDGCAFRDIYWDATNGGTDIELVSGTTRVLISGGAGLSGQVVLNSGTYNRVEDLERGDLGQSFRGSLTIAPLTGDTIATVRSSGGFDAILSLQAASAGGATAIIRAGDTSTLQKGAFIYPINESGARDDSWIVSMNAVERWQFQKAGDLASMVAGTGFRIKEGSNARMGVATLVGGTITVANTSVTASTRIFVSRTTTGGTPGHLSTTQIAATSFTVNSTSGTDTSTLDWLLMEPG